MGTIHTYEEKGIGGEKWWFVAVFPPSDSGATRYYETENARDNAVKEYCDYISKHGGIVLIQNHGDKSATPA
jgi:hypothetical protein